MSFTSKPTFKEYILQGVRKNIQDLELELTDISFNLGGDPGFPVGEMVLTVWITILGRFQVYHLFPDSDLLVLKKDFINDHIIYILSKKIETFFLLKGPDSEYEPFHRAWLNYQNKLFWDFIDKAPQNSSFNK